MEWFTRLGEESLEVFYEKIEYFPILNMSEKLQATAVTPSDS